MKIIDKVEAYKVREPLFEGVRVIMSYLGEPYSPQYIQGIAGASFRISTGCPSRPTCCYLMWPAGLIKLLGYECKEIPCIGPNGEDLIDTMITEVRSSIDFGRPVLVWNAMTNMEWDVVSGYDDANCLFYGMGSYRGKEGNYHIEPWGRAASDKGLAFGAITIGEKTGAFDSRKAEITALRDAVTHARTVKDKPENGGWYSYEGIQALKKWSEDYSKPGKDRGIADGYCFSIYRSTHYTACGFLREIAPRYNEKAKNLLLEAASYMEQEADVLKSCAPYIGLGSRWGVDEERSRAVAPLLSQTAKLYEKAIECIEMALEVIE